MAKKSPSNDQKRRAWVDAPPIPDIESMAAGIVVTALELMDGIDDYDECVRLAGQALRDGDTADKRTSLVLLLYDYPVKPDNEHPSLRDLLDAMWQVDKAVTCKAILGNCQRKSFWGDPEIAAWKSFIDVAKTLFPLDRMETYPLDQEMKEVVDALYGPGTFRAGRDKIIRKWAREAIGEGRDSKPKKPSPDISNQIMPESASSGHYRMHKVAAQPEQREALPVAGETLEIQGDIPKGKTKSQKKKLTPTLAAQWVKDAGGNIAEAARVHKYSRPYLSKVYNKRRMK